MNILVGTPYYKEVGVPFVISLMNMLVVLSSHTFKNDHIFIQGTSAPAQRNSLTTTAIVEGYDYLLMVDSDMVFESDAVLSLLDVDKDIVGAVYFGRLGENKDRLMVFAEDIVETSNTFRQYKGVEYLPSRIEPFKVAGIGSGLLLMKVSALKSLTEKEVIKKWGFPFNLWQMSSGRQLGTDLSFCHRANLSGIEIWADPRPRIGHIYEDINYTLRHI